MDNREIERYLLQLVNPGLSVKEIDSLEVAQLKSEISKLEEELAVIPKVIKEYFLELAREDDDRDAD